MYKKMGVVTVGVAAGLVAAAPFASASECSHDTTHTTEKSSSADCTNTGGGAGASAGNVAKKGYLLQEVKGGDVMGNITCSTVLSDNLNGNNLLSNNLNGAFSNNSLAL